MMFSKVCLLWFNSLSVILIIYVYIFKNLKKNINFWKIKGVNMNICKYIVYKLGL